MAVNHHKDAASHPAVLQLGKHGVMDAEAGKLEAGIRKSRQICICLPNCLESLHTCNDLQETWYLGKPLALNSSIFTTRIGDAVPSWAPSNVACIHLADVCRVFDITKGTP